MPDTFDHESADWRIKAGEEAQRRARFALLLATIVSAAILAAEWNAYFSWDRQWATWPSRPDGWAQRQVLTQEIKSWVETNTVGVSILGLRLSVSDAAVMGSLALLIAAFYLCMCASRENEEIGGLLYDFRCAPMALRHRVFTRLRAAMVLGSPSDERLEFMDLSQPRRSQAPTRLARLVLWLLVFLPTLTIAGIIASDLYFTFLDFSPQRHNNGTAWSELARRYKIELVGMDVFAFIVGILTLRFCGLAWRYFRGTERVAADFHRQLQVIANDAPQPS